MGLRGFYQMLKKNRYVPKPLEAFDESFGFDAKALAYRYAYGVDVGDDVVIVTARRMNKMIDKLRELGAKKIIMCCDSPNNVPVEKKATLTTRKTNKRKLQVRSEEAVKQQKIATDAKTIEKCDKIIRAARGVTSEQVVEIMTILTSLNNDVHICMNEADFGLASLSETNICTYIVGDDADLLLNCKKLVRGLPAFLGGNNIPPVVYDQADIMKCLKLQNTDEFIQLACLLSCDYVKSITNVGPVTALKAIQEHKNIETFVNAFDEKQLKKFKLPVGTMQEYQLLIAAACELFKNYRPDTVALVEKFKE